MNYRKSYGLKQPFYFALNFVHYEAGKGSAGQFISDAHLWGGLGWRTHTGNGFLTHLVP